MGNRDILILIGEVRAVNRLAQRAKLLGPAISPSDPFAARVVGRRRFTTPSTVGREWRQSGS
jgi:hypothetical protein